MPKVYHECKECNGEGSQAAYDLACMTFCENCDGKGFIPSKAWSIDEEEKAQRRADEKYSKAMEFLQKQNDLLRVNIEALCNENDQLQVIKSAASDVISKWLASTPGEYAGEVPLGPLKKALDAYQNAEEKTNV
jgi:DnaJ-class molecular chaperone